MHAIRFADTLSARNYARSLVDAGYTCTECPECFVMRSDYARVLIVADSACKALGVDPTDVIRMFVGR